MSVNGFSNDYIRRLVQDGSEPNVKQHFEYDSNVDIISIYRAQSSASNGDNCLRQRLEYVTVSGERVISNIDWITSTWSSAWDI